MKGRKTEKEKDGKYGKRLLHSFIFLQRYEKKMKIQIFFVSLHLVWLQKINMLKHR